MKKEDARDVAGATVVERRSLPRIAPGAQDAGPPTMPRFVGGPRPMPPGLPADTGAAMRGAQLGRYIILEPLGAGGMGEVYTAYDPALDRRVALKVIRPMADHGSTEGARSLLLAEAQALAKLSHPHIVHVYDVGTLGGDIYIAMEYIDGITLKAWLAEARTWQATIATFMEAGRGLEAAHAAGIVHRDFKPDNVLIGKDGRVRVIDFGIALGPQQRADPDHLLGSRSSVGTPAFMAPEQFQCEEVGPAADQFGFAVSLYEALWKQHAFAGDSEAAVKFNVVDGNLTPPPPSPVPPRIRDAVLRALARDPAARHPSMTALLAAIAPVPRRARAPYVIGAGVITAVAGLAIVLGLRGGAAAEPCTGFDDDLAGVWDPARKAAVQQQVHPDAWPTLERELDGYGQAWIGRKVAACRATAVTREQTPAVMERRMSCLDTRRRELDAAITLVAAGGEPAAKAMEIAGGLRALAGCDNLAALAPLPTAPPAALHAIEDGLARMRAMRLAGAFKAAREAAAPVIAECEKVAWGSGVARALVERGLTEGADGDPTTARETLFEAVRRADEARDEASVAAAWVALVDVDGSGLRKPSEGLRWAKHADIALAQAGGDQEQQGELLHNVAAALRFLDRTEEALDHERRALALFERAFGPNHVRVANQRGSVANMLRFLARFDESRKEGEAVLAQLEQLVGPNHVYVATALNNLALTYDELDMLEQARTSLERAVTIRERTLGKDHGTLANPLMNIVSLERRAGHFDSAERLWQRAVTIRIATLGPNHPDVTRALHGKLIDRINRGIDEEARLLIDEVITRHRARTDAVELSGAIAGRCELQRRAGELDAAAASCREAITALGPTPDKSRALFTLTYAARLAAERGELAEAEALLVRIQESLPFATRDKAVARGFVGWAAAHIALAAGRRVEALTIARESREALESHGKNFTYMTDDLARLR